MPTPTTQRRHTAWLIGVALAIGVGLIAMHASLSCTGHDAGAGHEPRSAHASSVEHGHTVVAMPAVVASLHAGPCLECLAHTSTTMVCAVLLLAVAGALGVRLLLRRMTDARSVALILTTLAASWAQRRNSFMARAPNLHALQVMRC